MSKSEGGRAKEESEDGGGGESRLPGWRERNVMVQQTKASCKKESKKRERVGARGGVAKEKPTVYS